MFNGEIDFYLLFLMDLAIFIPFSIEFPSMEKMLTLPRLYQKIIQA